MVLKNLGIGERVHGRYTATLVDPDGVAVPASALSSLTLTLTDEKTGEVLNGRQQQNVLNTNDVTVDGSGALIWWLQPADNAIVDLTLQSGDTEKHRATFKWTTTAGKTGSHAVFISVVKDENIGTGLKVLSQVVYANDGVTPVQNPTGYLTSDSAGNIQVYGPVQGTKVGVLTFYVSPGTYYLWVSHPLHTFNNPTSVTVV